MAAATQLLSANQVALLYLVASVLFILALKGLSHPLSARRGNRFGIAGMVIAVLVTFAVTEQRDDLARRAGRRRRRSAGTRPSASR